ncbi:hypothetical protein PIB30_045255 [Stylosanthes scabra]|uniref:Uncharacterized protein n=1 Tax=Stylosanthes scabra TaxID=79078 RepID=A0ABU6YES4_9FABA|nr:hypothetical protein [Stylosanthes scabra]
MPEEGIKGRVGVDLLQVYGGKHFGGEDWLRNRRFAGGESYTVFVDNLLMKEGKRLFLTLSKFRRGFGIHKQGIEQAIPRRQGQRVVHKWIEVRTSRQKVDKTGDHNERKEVELYGRKEIKAIWSIDQKERLLGVCVKPIEFRKVINLLLED